MANVNARILKLLIGVALILLLGLLGYVAAGPWITIAEIRQGVETRDSERLTANIDFPSLRKNVKMQFRSALIERGQRESENAALGLALAGLGGALVDGIVDTALTPEGLAALMSGQEQAVLTTSPGTEAHNPQAQQQSKPELFADARYTYDWHDRFSVWVPNDDGSEIRFILARQGLSWRLSNVVLPLDAMQAQ